MAICFNLLQVRPSVHGFVFECVINTFLTLLLFFTQGQGFLI